MARIIIILALLLFLLPISPSFAQTDLPTDRVPERRENLRETIQQRKLDSREDTQARKDEFRQRVQTITDERKRNALIRIENKISQINERRTNHMTDFLEKLSSILGRFESRAESLETQGENTEVLETAILEAQTAISQAEEAVATQAAKEYPITFTDETMLRESVAPLIAQLKEDLRNTFEVVQTAKEKVVAVARALSQLNGD